jgi:hypothetical protein
MKQVLPGGGRVGTSGRGQDVRKKCMRVNMVEILSIQVGKWKNETC